MEIAALVVAVVTLIFALFIHSETRETLDRIHAMTDTLPGAHDVKRVLKDVEVTKTLRAKGICVEPKNTFVAWEPSAAEPLPLKTRFWICVRKVANRLSGSIYESVVEDKEIKKKWDIHSCNIISAEVDELLTQGWQPFSVTNDDKLWLRKGVIVKE